MFKKVQGGICRNVLQWEDSSEKVQFRQTNNFLKVINNKIIIVRLQSAPKFTVFWSKKVTAITVNKEALWASKLPSNARQTYFFSNIIYYYNGSE